MNGTDNINKPKHPGGRPLKFPSVEILQEKINEYFDYCDKGEIIKVYDKKKQEVVELTQKIPYTVTGLAVFLDTDRSTLIEYQERDEFSNTIKNAKQKIENSYETNALTGVSNPVFSIFTLKNNYNWKDKQEIDVVKLPDLVLKDYRGEGAEEPED